MKKREELEERLAEIESDERLHYGVARVQVNAPLALEQIALKTKVDMLRWILEMPPKRHYGRDKEDEEESVTITTVLNPIVEKIDLFDAYCPTCGPNHTLDNEGEGKREDKAWCEQCDWEGTCGDLMDLLAKLDSDDED